MSEKSFKERLGSALSTLAVVLLAIIIAVVVFAAITVLHGATIVKMWEWFLTPLGLPQIGFAHALGLGTLVNYFRVRAPQAELEAKDPKALQRARAGFVFLLPLMTLGVGYVVHLFM